jgi:hypothetical protein
MDVAISVWLAATTAGSPQFVRNEAWYMKCDATTKTKQFCPVGLDVTVLMVHYLNIHCHDQAGFISRG